MVQYMRHLYFTILVLTSNFITVSFAQLQLSPIVGIAVTKSKLIQSNSQLVALNWSDDFFGFELTKKINSRSSLSFVFHKSSAGFLAGDANSFNYKYPIEETFKNKVYGKRHQKLSGTGDDLKSFGFIGEYKLLDAKHIQILPSFGFTLNKINNTCNDCSTVSFGVIILDSNNNVVKDEMIEYKSGFLDARTDYIVKNWCSWSLNFGVKFQFTNKYDKDRLFVKFMYSQGLMTILQSPFSRNLAIAGGGVPPRIGEGVFRSRGTYWTIYASYPITIVNKKGERYRDRHPKT